MLNSNLSFEQEESLSKSAFPTLYIDLVSSWADFER